MAKRLLTILIFVLVCSCSSKQVNEVTIDIKGESITFDLALDFNSRRLGLMHRDKIEDGRGMLFVFPDANERSFWMKNCLFNIDLIFLDSRGTITAVHSMKTENQKYESETQFEYENRLNHYWSNGPARFAMEFKEGTNDKFGLKVNDKLNLDLNYLKSLAR